MTHESDPLLHELADVRDLPWRSEPGSVAAKVGEHLLEGTGITFTRRSTMTATAIATTRTVIG